MKSKKIVILYGGWNSEREVSLSSGKAVEESLRRIGYEDVVLMDYSRDSYLELQTINPDLVFNALHGKYGEDGCVQGMLDILGISYTHSGVLASSLCMDKILSKKICSQVGVKSPDYDILIQGQNQNNKNKIKKIGEPFVIKPNDEGSSVGVEVILKDSDFDIDNYEWNYGSEVIIEKYISGPEIQVAVIGEKSIGAIEVRPKKLFYDYECKYTKGMTDYIMPAEIDSQKYKEALDLAAKCHNQLRCRALTRVDFKLSDKDGEFYLLEVNTQPGFTPLSLVPQIAAHVGISFDEIVEFLINQAL
ncbi:MAG: D-alanine--D-alanine ligase [Rickettsiales bacterium]|nr:D-alanine--D-alanine ligase [Rickettsiales bacterium]